ncbi:MAG: histone deacetylase family protein [Pseudomonadales bacterium]|jgi:acetoin utilization deacetylase AcuC-like enzyme|nr:histone deacetylase family protein [Pseudomonadales bacterium]
MIVAYVSHPACARHRPPAGHPECPERLAVIEELLMSQGVFDFLLHVEAPRCPRELLERVHAPALLAQVIEHEPRAGHRALDGDTLVGPGSAEAALRAAGAAVAAVEGVLAGRFDRAFCAVRPPGHHATRDRAMGFCLFDNIALGATRALDADGVRRLAIVDFDAHRGNGTEALFAENERVLYCGLHEAGLFPPPRREPAASNVCEIALAPGSSGQVLRREVERVWAPALAAHAPELLLVSAGFDGHARDDMSALTFGEADFRWLSEFCVAIADRHASGRVVSVLEGGYDLPSLGRCAAAHVRTLMAL